MTKRSGRMDGRQQPPYSSRKICGSKTPIETLDNKESIRAEKNLAQK